MPEKPSPFLAAEWPNSELPGASTHRQHGAVPYNVTPLAVATPLGGSLALWV